MLQMQTSLFRSGGKKKGVFQSMFINVLQSVCESAESVPLTVLSITSLAFCQKNCHVIVFLSSRSTFSYAVQCTENLAAYVLEVSREVLVCFNLIY